MKFLMGMLTILLIIAFILPASAQTQRFGATGLAFDTQSTPNLKGWGTLALPVSENIYSYTTYDVAPVTKGGDIEFLNVRLQYTIRTGFARKLITLTPRYSLYALGDAGISADSQNVVGAFAGGGFLDIEIKNGWGTLIILQAEKNAVTGTHFAPRVGIRKKL